MSPKCLVYGVRVGVFAGIFAAGYLCGSITEHRANAQMGGLGELGGQIGGDLLKSAAGSGGIIGTAAQLGTAITDMEKNVNGLQKNLDTLKKVKAALGGK